MQRRSHPSSAGCVLASVLVTLLAASPLAANEHFGPTGFTDWFGFREGTSWPGGPLFLPLDTRYEGEVTTLLVDAFAREGDSGLLFGPLLQYRGLRGDGQQGATRRRSVTGEEEAFEGGAFLRIERGAWSFGSAFASGLGGAKNRTLLDLSISYKHFITDNLALGYGARTTWASDAYLQRYYAVERGAGAANGSDWLDGDFRDVGLSLTAWYRFDAQWSLVGTLNAGRVLGGLSDSDLVEEEGTRNRFRAGGALNFRF